MTGVKMKKIMLLCLVLTMTLTACGFIKSKIPLDSIVDIAKELGSDKKSSTVEVEQLSDEDFLRDYLDDGVYEASDNPKLEEIRQSIKSTFDSDHQVGNTSCMAQWNQPKNLTIKCKVDDFGVLTMLYPTITHTVTLAVTGLSTVSELTNHLPEGFVVTVMLTIKGKPVYTARTSLGLLEKIASGDVGTQEKWLEEAEIIK